MRILMVTPMVPSTEADGAIPLVLRAQLSALRERHDVTLLTITDGGTRDELAIDRLRADGTVVHTALRSRPQSTGRWQRRKQLARGWAWDGYPWRTVYFWSPEAQPQLDRLLAEGSFDLVTAEDNATAVYHYRTSAPVLLTEHEVRRPRPIQWRGHTDEFGARWSLARSLLAELDWRRWQQYQPAVWNRFSRIQVFSKRDAAAIGAMAPHLAGRVRVNPFSVDLPPPVDVSQEEPGLLLFVGNFTHPPNVDAARMLANEVMPVIRQHAPGARLLLVGRDPPPSIQALARPDIAVNGYVPDLSPLLARASVVVAPIRTGGGMRMKVLHSMGSGKAVVTTPRGAEGLTALSHDPPVRIAEGGAAFALAAIDLMQDVHGRRALGRQARAFVAEHFSPAAYGRRLDEIYAELRPRLGAAQALVRVR